MRWVAPRYLYLSGNGGCNGFGGDYKSMKIMKDREAAVAAGLVIPTEETCTGCHNPHGSAQDHNLKTATVKDLCVRCHAEKKGPFLVEHGTVLTRDCLNCHDGSGAAGEATTVTSTSRSRGPSNSAKNCLPPSPRSFLLQPPPSTGTWSSSTV